MTRRPTRLESMLADAARLSDEELLELHRVLSITASRIRLRDPEYQRRYEAGMQSPRAVAIRAAQSGAAAQRRRSRLELVQ